MNNSNYAHEYLHAIGGIAYCMVKGIDLDSVSVVISASDEAGECGFSCADQEIARRVRRGSGSAPIAGEDALTFARVASSLDFLTAKCLSEQDIASASSTDLTNDEHMQVLLMTRAYWRGLTSAQKAVGVKLADLNELMRLSDLVNPVALEKAMAYANDPFILRKLQINRLQDFPRCTQ